MPPPRAPCPAEPCPLPGTAPRTVSPALGVAPRRPHVLIVTPATEALPASGPAGPSEPCGHQASPGVAHSRTPEATEKAWRWTVPWQGPLPGF